MAGSTRTPKRAKVAERYDKSGRDLRPWQNNLRTYRERKRMTQGQLAAKIGRAQTLIAGIEVGRLSGRAYMDEIADVLGVPPDRIFPDYYGYHTIEEAAEHFGVTSSMVASSLEKGKIDYKVIGHTYLIPDEELERVSIKKPVPLREKIKALLQSEPEGMTVTDLVEKFGPFGDDTEQKRKFMSVYQALARSDEFVAEGPDRPPRWKLSDAA